MRSIGFAIVIGYHDWWMVGHRVVARCPECGVESEIAHAIDEHGFVAIICPRCKFNDWVLVEGWVMCG